MLIALLVTLLMSADNPDYTKPPFGSAKTPWDGKPVLPPKDPKPPKDPPPKPEPIEPKK